MTAAIGVAVMGGPPGPVRADDLPYPALAARIAAALRPAAGERVLFRFDPAIMPELETEVRRALEAAGAVVDVLPYGPAPDLETTLERTDVYVWLPAPERATPFDQRLLLNRWLDGGDGRELHFHWVDGTRDVDGLPAAHSAAYDRVYVEALDIDYAALGARMDRAIERLRSGVTRVTTPAGTDVRFRVGDRPFNRQNGDASKERAAQARIRIDRHIELPAGVLRVAPIEDSVSGRIVLPKARFGDVTASSVRLELEDGVVTRATAASGERAVLDFLASDPAASRFRELGLGFNPKLVVPPGETALPYYGYGAGVVRMSLGDNSELGGAVTGGTVRWLFFPDATVTAGGAVLVEDGKLILD
jgi:hypothetical protein